MNEQTREKRSHETAPEPGAGTEEAKQEAPAAEAVAQAPAEPSPEEQLAEMKDRLLRAMAEAENVRRRAERDTAEALKFGIARFARDLLGVADNLRRAIEAVPGEKRDRLDEAARTLVSGVELVERELLTAFERHGIKPLRPEKGAKFDPNLHQAMAEVPDPDAQAGSVVDVFQIGYVIGDRLLRPAMVTVAKADPSQDEAEIAQKESTAKRGESA